VAVLDEPWDGDPAADQLRACGIPVLTLPPELAEGLVAVVARSVADGRYRVLVAERPDAGRSDVGVPDAERADAEQAEATWAAVWSILAGTLEHPPWRVVASMGPLRAGGPFLVVGLRPIDAPLGALAASDVPQ